MAEALAMLKSGLGYLAALDKAGIPCEVLGELLRALERADAVEAAVRGEAMAAFDAQDGSVADGQRTMRAWMVNTARPDPDDPGDPHLDRGCRWTPRWTEPGSCGGSHPRMQRHGTGCSGRLLVPEGRDDLRTHWSGTTKRSPRRRADCNNASLSPVGERRTIKGLFVPPVD